MNLNHLHLNSPNVESSLDFYRRYFGLRRKPSAPDAPFFLEDGQGFLMAISEIDEPAELPAWFHLGFAKLEPEQVRRLYRRMKADGVPMAKELVEDDDVVAFWCRDPAGYKIEVSWFQADS